MFQKEFLVIVGNDYGNIKMSFSKGIKRFQIPFSEDTFHDTLLMCSTAYNDDITSLMKIKSYLWTAFKLNSIKRAQRARHYDDISKAYNMADSSDDYRMEEIDELAEYIKQELYKKFGEPYTNLWLRHVCCNETYEKLIQETGNTNLKYICRKILKYVREELTKRDLKTKQMIEDLRIRD